MNTRRLICLAFAVFLSGCAQHTPRDGVGNRTPTANETTDAIPRSEPRSTSGNPPFYDQFGKRYHVLNTAEGYTERGVASWYGKQFHGRRTSNGEIFDMYAMSAAHKTLPLPAYVEVKNLRNGKVAVVRVNDRGPFVDNRIIDLSYAAATKLGIVQDGTGLVQIRTLGAEQDRSSRSTRVVATQARPPAPIATPVPLAQEGQIFVQVGAFSDPGNAQRLQRKIQKHGIAPVFVAEEIVNNTAIHRVRVGPVKDVDAYDLTVARLQRMGINDAVLAFE